MSLAAALHAIESFLSHEQATIDGMLLFSQHGLSEKPLTTALLSCGDLDAAWQRAQAVEVLLDTLDHIVQIVASGFDEDWDDDTRTRFHDLTLQARAAIHALDLPFDETLP